MAKNFYKSALISLLSVTTLFYSALFIFDVEKKIVFDPRGEYKEPANFLAGKLKVNQFVNKDNLKLTYWSVDGDKSKPAVLYCHGNADNISYFQDRIKFLVDNGYRVFMIEYRGYGSSEGKPSEEGLYRDLESMISHLRSDYGISKKDLIVWGHSLGGAVVADVTSRKNFRGVILEGTFTKLSDVKNYAAKFKSNSKQEEMFNYVLYNLIPLTQKFESINKIQKIRSPLFVLHSKPDDIIPYWMGEKLAEQNEHARFYLSETGGHDEPTWNNHVILDFIREL